MKTRKQQNPFSVLTLTQLFVCFVSVFQVLTWSQVTTFCTSTRVRTLMGRCWRVYKATRPQSASRAAGTASSWRSDRTPHWACLALPSNIEVIIPKTVSFLPAHLKWCKGCGSGRKKGLGFDSWTLDCCFPRVRLSLYPGYSGFPCHFKNTHVLLIGNTKLAHGVVASVDCCCLPCD